MLGFFLIKSLHKKVCFSNKQRMVFKIFVTEDEIYINRTHIMIENY